MSMNDTTQQFTGQQPTKVSGGVKPAGVPQQLAQGGFTARIEKDLSGDHSEGVDRVQKHVERQDLGGAEKQMDLAAQYSGGREH